MTPGILQDVTRSAVSAAESERALYNQLTLEYRCHQASAVLVALFFDFRGDALPQDIPGVDRNQSLFMLAHEADESRRSRVLLAADMAS